MDFSLDVVNFLRDRAQMLRSVDRQRNVDAYPKVDFPEIYVVDKGYRNFFEIFRESSDRVSFVYGFVIIQCSVCERSARSMRAFMSA